MQPKKFSIKERFKSFTYAWGGVKLLFQSEHNTIIHLVLTVIAVVAGFMLSISRIEWIALIIVIAMVWTAELFNTAIEKTMDFITKERLLQIKLIKDVAAAAVLITAIAAVVVGLLIFIPKIISL
ncbi:MAG: diacylglycerol kinase [Chitinophagaceae bacterium]